MKRRLKWFTDNPLFSVYHSIVHRIKKFGACYKNFYEESIRL